MVLRKKKNKTPEGIDTPATAENPSSDQSVKAPSKGMEKSRQASLRVTETWEKPSSSDGPIKVAYEHKNIPIGQIVHDEQNSRTRNINPANPSKNMLDPDHPEYEETQEVIQEIIEMSEHLKVTHLQSPIEVYPYRGKYKIAFGSVRYFASKLAFGDRYSVPANVLEQPPNNLHVERFVENFARKRLRLRPTLMDFKKAYADLANHDKVKEGEEYNALGISKTQFYQLKNIVVVHPDIYEAAINGVIKTLGDAKEISVKFKTREERIAVYKVLEENPGIKLSKVEELLKNAKSENKVAKVQGRKGRARTSLSIPAIKGKETSVKVFRSIIDGGLKSLNWDGVNWEDLDSVQSRLNKNIEILVKQSAKQ